MVLTDLQLASLARSLRNRLSNEARRRGVTADVIRKQYVFTLFLSRLFDTDPQPPWVLLGGNALLIRTGSGRFTQDIDLARESEWESAEGVRAELQSLADGGTDRDPFTFVVVSVEPHSEPDPYGYGTKTANAKVQASLGAQVFDTFTIDLTRGVTSTFPWTTCRCVRSSSTTRSPTCRRCQRPRSRTTWPIRCARCTSDTGGTAGRPPRATETSPTSFASWTPAPSTPPA